MPKFLADGKDKLALLPSRPTDIEDILVTEATAGTDISATVLAPLTLGPSGSDTIDERDLTAVGNGVTFGPSNFEGSITLFRYYNSTTEQPDGSEDANWTTLKTKGTTVRCLHRKSAKASTDAFADNDEVRYTEWTTDDPIDESGEGYIKFRIPLAYAGTASLDTILNGSS